VHVVLIGPDWDSVARFLGDLVRDFCVAGWRVIIATGGEPGVGAVSLATSGAECVSMPLARMAPCGRRARGGD
jgi:hypothetical protein